MNKISTIKRLITKSCEAGMIDTKEHGELIEYQERLEKPTEKMYGAFIRGTSFDDGVRAMLAAAEESQ